MRKGHIHKVKLKPRKAASRLLPRSWSWASPEGRAEEEPSSLVTLAEKQADWCLR